MDLHSQHTIALLDAQYELDMNVEDTQIEVNETETELEVLEHSETQIPQSTRGPWKRRKTSPVWVDFVSVGFGDDGKERAKCKHCDTLLVIKAEGQGSYGTHHLSRHLQTCSKVPKKGARPAYDQKVDREMATEVIIYHDLPFRYIEYEKVRSRDKYLNPDCQPICRQTIAADVLRRFVIEKEKLKERLAKHQGRVCFTSDLWTSRPTVTGYICLTCHFIDANWKLNSYILTFCELKPPHTGDALAVKILGSLREWGLEKKVFSITLDNAKNNDSMLRILKGQLQMMSGSGNGLLCEGKFMHVRCCAHILNLIVKEGLELAEDLLHNIRESVRYVKASQSRIEAFAACVARVGSKSASGLSLDVPTRWNSTYEMLVRALRFRTAFVSMELYDTNYKTLPSEEEWNRGERISEILKPFSVITGCLYTGSWSFMFIFIQDLFELERNIGGGVGSTKTHLDVYLEEARLERKSFPNLDVLGYWKDNQDRFGDLASMAFDVLSIPITTVASESAFSNGGRVLTPYRNRLIPEKVQALLCTRNWLRGFAEYEGTIEDIDDNCIEDARTYAASSSGIGCSRSGDSSVP